MRVLVRGRLWVLVLAMLASSACRRPAAAPSAEYDKAWRIYANLYARQLDDAFGNPQMDEVVALLKQVDSKSADADAARTLLSRIDDGRKAQAKDRAEADKRRADLRPDNPSASVTQAASQMAARAVAALEVPVASAAVDGGPVDAGPSAPDPFAEGAPIAALNRDGCLISGEPFKEQNTNRTGQTYRLAQSATCQARLPGLQDQIVLVVDGRIYRRVAAKSVNVTQQPGAPAPGAVGAAQGQPPAAAPPPAPGTPPSAPAGDPNDLPAGQLPPPSQY